MDNIFGDTNIDWAETNWVHSQIQGLAGDIVEFGTGSGASTEVYALKFPYRQLWTIDHFNGLEKSAHAGPTEWQQGVFKFSLEETQKKLAALGNVHMIVCDIHKLLHPLAHGIKEVAFANIDVDLYEPTVSALRFLGLCVWKKIVLRFDDWHGHEAAFDQHERLACKEWLDANGYRYAVACGGSSGGVIVER